MSPKPSRINWSKLLSTILRGTHSRGRIRNICLMIWRSTYDTKSWCKFMGVSFRISSCSKSMMIRFLLSSWYPCWNQSSWRRGKSYGKLILIPMEVDIFRINSLLSGWGEGQFHQGIFFGSRIVIGKDDRLQKHDQWVLFRGDGDRIQYSEVFIMW